MKSGGNVKETAVETVNGAEIVKLVIRTSTGSTVGRRHFSHTTYAVRRAGKSTQFADTLAAAREMAK